MTDGDEIPLIDMQSSKVIGMIRAGTEIPVCGGIFLSMAFAAKGSPLSADEVDAALQRARDLPPFEDDDDDEECCDDA